MPEARHVTAAFVTLVAAVFPVYPSHAQRQSPSTGYANIRTLSLDSETVRVTLGPSAAATHGVFVTPASPPPSTTSPSPAPSGAPDARVLTLANLHDVVHASADDLARCTFDAARNGRVHGSIVVRLVIDPHGAIRDVAVPQSNMVWSVPRCVVDVAQRWRFRPPPGGFTVVVVLPLAFESAATP